MNDRRNRGREVKEDSEIERDRVSRLMKMYKADENVQG